MNATVYKSLSNRGEIATVSPGQSVSAAFPDIDFSNAVIIVNGEERTADYVIREFDVITVRELPGMTAVTIAMVAIAIGAGVYCGIQMYKAKRAAEEAQKELDKVKKQSNKDDIDNRPFLRGASNTLAKDKSQPYVCGRHFFTPYLLNSPFYSITGTDGADEYTYVALECGFNKQIIQKIAIEDIVIKTFTDTEPQEGAYDIDAGVFAEDGRIEIAQDGNPFGELSALNYKVVSAACNDEIPRDVKVDRGDAEYLTYTLDANAMNVTVAVTFPYGLYAYNDDAAKIETRCRITTEYSTDGGKTWTKVRENNFTRNESSKEIRFTQAYSFDWDDYYDLHSHGQKNIMIRVRSNGNEDAQIKNDCYVLFYQSRCFDPEKSSEPAGSADFNKRELVPCKILEDRERAFCTMIGLRLKASPNNEDKLKKINIITQGVARTWSGRTWSGGRTATSNPAAWALEILTSESHPMSRFADGEIDLESFGDFYEHCEKNEYRFDYVITQGRKKGDTLDLILQNCGATMYKDLYGRLAVAIDRAQGNAIAVYNPQNIVSIENKKKFGRRTDGLRVKYTSSEDDIYQEDTYLLMREVDGKPLELNADSAIKDVTATGITTFRHVVKYARRLMALEALRPKTTTIEVGNEGVYFTPYSKILLQDDSLKIGTGNGVIKATQWENGRLAKIYLDCPVTFEGGKRYGVTVNCFGGENRAVPLSLEVSGEGYTDALTVVTSVPETAEAIPEVGCVVSFGERDSVRGLESITTPYLISGISRSENGFRLELVNYDPAIYSSGTIPDYRSNITQKPPVKSAAIPPDFVTQGEMMDAIVNGINTSAEPPDTPMVAECKAYRDYVSARLSALPEEDKNTLKNVEWQVNKDGFWRDFSSNLSFSARYDFDRKTDGYPEAEDLGWQVRCRVTNTRGMVSEWSAPMKVDTSQYGTWRVSSVRDASAKTYGSDSMGLRFDGKRPNERQYYGSTRFTVIVKYDGKPIRTETDALYSLYYYFDRDTDGYPERHANASDGIRDLSLYSFTIRPVESFTGEIGEDTVVAVDDSSYGTWLIPPIETSAVAGEHSVMLQWSMDGATPYGTVRYDVCLGGKAIAENVSGTYRAYRFSENLSKEEVGALEFSVRARNEAHERTERFSVDASAYLGYKIDKPWIRAAARREGIDVSWDRMNEFYGKCEFVLLKDGVEAFRSARDREFFLPFGEDEFPEKEDIARISLKVRVEGDADSAESDDAETDTSGYLTYVPSVPKCYPSASGRNANLSWDSQDKVYGFTGCDVQIAKAYRAEGGKIIPITDAGGLEWHAPALGLNPYESLENYKRGDAGGYLEVRGNSVSFSLPLFGQDGGGAEDTPYAFRLRGRSAAGKTSEWTDATFVLCRAISAYDVVKAWDLDDKGEKIRLDGALGARQVFVEELSAISANLGYITDGALKGNAYNYWAVGDVRADDGSTMWRGSFRVGGKDQYILVEPRLEDGAPTGEYDITFVVGNYSVSASGTQIRGGAFEVYDDKGNLMFSISPDGSRIRVATGTYNSKEAQAEIPQTLNQGYSNFLTVKDGEDMYALIPILNEHATSMEDTYIVEVYKVGASSCELAWRVEELTLAYSLHICMAIHMTYALAADGKFTTYGMKYDSATDTAYVGTYSVDIRSKSAEFSPLNEEEMDFGGYNDINKVFPLGDRVFFSCSKRELNGTRYLTSYQYFMIDKGGVARMFPDNNYFDEPLGVAVRGGYAYAAVRSLYWTIVTRRDLATGAMSFMIFVGNVKLNAGGLAGTDVEVSGLSVDDENITLLGECFMLKDFSARPDPEWWEFVGAARIPLKSAVWNAWDGRDFPDEFMTTTAVRLYRYSDIPDGKTTSILPVSPFLHEGALAVSEERTYDSASYASLIRLAFEDYEEPEYGDFVMAGRLVPDTVMSLQVDKNSTQEDLVKLYQKIHVMRGNYGACFPQHVGGIGAVRLAFANPTVYLDGNASYNAAAITVFDEEFNKYTGTELHSAGIGFVALYRDTVSKKRRYYMDTGDYIEFNEDGTLSGPYGNP